jgi:RNA polymerase sigma-70 factor (ECF subfamily)
MTQAISKIIDPDRQLVHAARGGDFDAFEQLVSKYEQSIYTLAMRIVQKSQDAEEVVQETFLSVVEHLKDFQEASTFHTWLVRIATNHALKLLRKRRGLSIVPLETSSDDDTPLPHPDFIAKWKEDPAAIAERNEAQAVIAKALENLEEKYRMVFLLRDVQGLSTEETAEALGIGISNVKVRLLRARLMLREQLTRLFGDQAARVISDREHEE